MIIEGAISVKAAINNHRRNVELVYIDKNKKTKDFNYIRKIARENNITINELDKSDLKNYLTGKSNGGVGALVGSRKEDEFSNDDIIFLDGIEDPFNIAYALRTLYALGFKNVLLNQRDYSYIEAQILKSSAGAFDMLNVRYTDDYLKDINALKNDGYYIYGLFRNESATDVFDCNFNNKAIYILGGEKRGIAKELLNICDEYLYISYASDFRNSLNAAAAVDILATLIYKQKR